MACEAALEIESPDRTKVLERLVLLESVQEYLWRILIDLPGLNGAGPATAELTKIRAILTKAERLLIAEGDWKTLGATMHPADLKSLHQLASEVRLLVENDLLGLDAESLLSMQSASDVSAWLDKSVAPIADQLRQAWTIRTPDADEDFLPQFPDSELADQIWHSMGAEIEFTRLPRHQGAAVETGALSRLQSHPLIISVLKSQRRVAARFVSRLLELAKILTELGSDNTTQSHRVGSKGFSEGVGGSWVETARGLLMHRIEIQGAKIVDYRILAPTEWNFHPQGRLIKELRSLEARSVDELEKRASMVCLSMDPCVGFDIEVNHA